MKPIVCKINITSMIIKVDWTTSGFQENTTNHFICWCNPGFTSSLLAFTTFSVYETQRRAAAPRPNETVGQDLAILNWFSVLFNLTAQSFLWAPDILPSSFPKWHFGSGGNYSWKNWCHRAEREVNKNVNKQANNLNVEHEKTRPPWRKKTLS